MALLGFQQRFVQKVLDGEKTHTIRPHRTNPVDVGEWLHLYAKPRQKDMRLLFRAPCVRIERILIQNRPIPEISVNGIILSPDERELLAVRDGFESFREMMSFWTNRVPFHGTIIHWDYSKRTMEKKG